MKAATMRAPALTPTPTPIFVPVERPELGDAVDADDVASEGGFGDDGPLLDGAAPPDAGELAVGEDPDVVRVVPLEPAADGVEESSSEVLVRVAVVVEEPSAVVLGV